MLESWFFLTMANVATHGTSAAADGTTTFDVAAHGAGAAANGTATFDVATGSLDVTFHFIGVNVSRSSLDGSYVPLYFDFFAAVDIQLRDLTFDDNVNLLLPDFVKIRDFLAIDDDVVAINDHRVSTTRNLDGSSVNFKHFHDISLFILFMFWSYNIYIQTIMSTISIYLFFNLLYLLVSLLYLLWKRSIWLNIIKTYSRNILKIHLFFNYKKSWATF